MKEYKDEDGHAHFVNPEHLVSVSIGHIALETSGEFYINMTSNVGLGLQCLTYYTEDARDTVYNQIKADIKQATNSTKKAIDVEKVLTELREQVAYWKKSAEQETMPHWAADYSGRLRGLKEAIRCIESFATDSQTVVTQEEPHGKQD